jgi:hypothetical protein
MEQATALARALASAPEEILLMIALWTAAAAVAYHSGSDALDLLLWIIVLLVQSVPYLAALLVAVLSAFPKLRAGLVAGRHGKQGEESAV